VHEIQGRAALGVFAQGCGDLLIERRVVVVARPIFKQIAKDIECVRLTRVPPQEIKKKRPRSTGVWRIDAGLK
jgi:hypothetical protein